MTQYEAIEADIRRQVAGAHAQDTGDFVEFLGAGGVRTGRGIIADLGDVD